MSRSRRKHHWSARFRVPRFEQLEDRYLLTATDLPITLDPSVQQMPSVAVDPNNVNHVVVAYMDYSLFDTPDNPATLTTDESYKHPYAGIAVAETNDGGDQWQLTQVPLPTGFQADKDHLTGESNPVVKFDNVDHDLKTDGVQSYVFVSFMASTFSPDAAPLITNPAGGEPRALGFKSTNGIFVSRSENGGASWNTPICASPLLDPATAAMTAGPNIYDGVHQVPFEINPDLAIDTFPYLPADGTDAPKPNPNYGNLYVVWARFFPPGQYPGESDSTGGSQAMIAVSKDGGNLWTLQTQQRTRPGESTASDSVIIDVYDSGNVPAGAGGANWPHVAVGPAGDVYVSLYNKGDFSVYHSDHVDKNGIMNFRQANHAGGVGTPFGEEFPSPILLDNESFRVISQRAIVADPIHPGWVYVAESRDTNDSSGNPADPGDIIFAHSTDYGVTWDSQFKLNTVTTDILNDDNGGLSAENLPNDVVSNQAMPRLVTDQQGDVALIWYDSRHDPYDHNLDVFATISTDGGQTFSPNFRVTDLSFDPDAGQFIDAAGKTDYYIGDAIGLALGEFTIDGVVHHVMYAAWTDTRPLKDANGQDIPANQNIFVRRLELNPSNPPAGPSDRFEANDTPSTATELGTVIDRQFVKMNLSAGDQDWYRVTAVSENLAITATEEMPGGPLSMELYDADGTTLLATGSDELNSGGQVIGKRIAISDAVSDRNYLIRILPGTGSVSNDPVPYDLDVRSLTADLGSLAHAIENAPLLVSGDLALYRLTAAATGRFAIVATPGSGFQGQVQFQILDPNTQNVFDPESQEILAASHESANGSVGSLQVTKGQELFVKVFGVAAALGDVALELTNLDQFNSPQDKMLLLPAGAGPSAVQIANLNPSHDSFPDLIVSDAQDNFVTALLGNGDGTFQAPRQFAIGVFAPSATGRAEGIPELDRAVEVVDVDGDDLLDIIVTNSASSDVSVLLGNGDGTFKPQRRYNATVNPFGLAVGDLNDDGLPDLVTLDFSKAAGDGEFAVLLNNQNHKGTFKPPLLFPTPLNNDDPLATVRITDVNNDGHKDLIFSSDFDGPHILLGNGDGTFRKGEDFSSLGPGLAIADLNNDHKLDIVLASRPGDKLTYSLGNGDGTFQVPTDETTFDGGQSPNAVIITDFNGDHVLDAIVADTGVFEPTHSGPPAVMFYPGILQGGQFAGFGEPINLATLQAPHDLQVADVNGDGVMDVVAVDRDDVVVIFGNQPTINPNVNQQAARDFGTVVHLVQPTSTITPTNQDAWYRFVVPNEATPGAGNEVLDFSAGFTSQDGPGLGMEVVDASGNIRGSGARFRIVAHQGETLYAHVFGAAGSGSVRGAGAYSLAIDVLPQVVAVEAPSLLPGSGDQPGGPTTSLVLVLQGDRLDPAGAQVASNYTVIWLGPNGIKGGGDDQQIPVGDDLPLASQAVIYDASSNRDVSSGLTYPTAVRQTITLLFGTALPAGNYEITVSPNVEAASFSRDEAEVLSSIGGLTGHPVVTSAIQAGVDRTIPNLVKQTVGLGNLDVFQGGTSFLAQSYSDLGALLDALLSAAGDQSATTQQIIDQILDRFGPALGLVGQRSVSLDVLFLDPVSFGLVDPEGRSLHFNLQNPAQVPNNLQRTFVEVGGNVEVVVIANPVGHYELSVEDVPAHARGAEIYLSNQAPRVNALTGALRDGRSQTFSFDFGASAKTFAAAVLANSPVSSEPSHISFLSSQVNTLTTLSASVSLLTALLADSLALSATSTTNGDGLNSQSLLSPSQNVLDELIGAWDEWNRIAFPSLEQNEGVSTDKVPDLFPSIRVWQIIENLLDEVVAPQAATTPAKGQHVAHKAGDPNGPKQLDSESKQGSARSDRSATSSESVDATQAATSQDDTQPSTSTAQPSGDNRTHTTDSSTTPQGPSADVRSTANDQSHATAV